MLKKIIGKIMSLYGLARTNISYKYNASIRKSIKVLTPEESVNYILKTGCSLSRYGDGEFGIILERYKDKREITSKFQVFDEQLSLELESILKEGGSDDNNHIIGLPGCMFSRGTDYLCTDAARYWRKVGSEMIRPLRFLIDNKRCYVDSTLTRFYMSHRDKSNCKSFIAKLKEIWDGRDVLIVEGAQTRLGIGNDLFSNAKCIKRIIGPQKNAFEFRSQLLEAVKKALKEEYSNSNERPLVILSLGMTATILARDLSPYCQALDLGHIDIEYEWMKRDAEMKVAIEGKYTNEVDNCIQISNVIDDAYNRQIVKKIGL